MLAKTYDTQTDIKFEMKTEWLTGRWNTPQRGV